MRRYEEEQRKAMKRQRGLLKRVVEGRHLRYGEKRRNIGVGMGCRDVYIYN